MKSKVGRAKKVKVNLKKRKWIFAGVIPLTLPAVATLVGCGCSGTPENSRTLTENSQTLIRSKDYEQQELNNISRGVVLALIKEQYSKLSDNERKNYKASEINSNYLRPFVKNAGGLTDVTIIIKNPYASEANARLDFNVTLSHSGLTNNEMGTFSLDGFRQDTILTKDNYESLSDWNDSHTRLTIRPGVTVVAYQFPEVFKNLTTIDLPSSLLEIEQKSFALCNVLTTLNLEEVTSVGNSAFKNAPITAFTAEHLQNIGDFAFEKANFSSWQLPQGLAQIGNSAFLTWAASGTMIIPSSVVLIGDHGFESVTINELSFPPANRNAEGSLLRNIGAYAFAQARISVLNLPDNLVNIGDNCFENSPLKTLTFGNKLETIGSLAFSQAFAQNYGAKTSSLVFPSSIRIIGKGAFFSASFLQQVQFTNTTENKSHLERIENTAFASWVTDSQSAINLVIPESVVFIGDYAFASAFFDSLTFAGEYRTGLVLGEGSFARNPANKVNAAWRAITRVYPGAFAS